MLENNFRFIAVWIIVKNVENSWLHEKVNSEIHNRFLATEEIAIYLKICLRVSSGLHDTIQDESNDLNEYLLIKFWNFLKYFVLLGAFIKY